MAAINNLETTVKVQNAKIEEMQRTLTVALRDNRDTGNAYTRCEVFCIILAMTLLQALFIAYSFYGWRL